MDPAHRAKLLARAERVTEVPMLVLALVFLVAIALQENANLPEEAIALVDRLIWLIWAVFAVELAVKICLATDRRQYLRSHWPEVLAVAVPFLRPLRLLRLVVASTRLWAAARVVVRRRTFALVGIAGFSAVVLGATLVYAAERGGNGPIQTFGDALWWAALTLTTMVFGDIYPRTTVGRAVAIALAAVGISLFGLVTARVAAFFVEEEQSIEERKLDQILERLERLEQQGADRSRERT
jgi:voltage-gated potassium channel